MSTVTIREEILMQIRRFENCVRGLDGSIAEETDEQDKEQLMARRWTYVQEMIPTLKRLLELCKIHDVTWVKVKGHADNIENNRCDELARAAISKQK